MISCDEGNVEMFGCRCDDSIRHFRDDICRDTGEALGNLIAKVNNLITFIGF